MCVAPTSKNDKSQQARNEPATFVMNRLLASGAPDPAHGIQRPWKSDGFLPITRGDLCQDFELNRRPRPFDARYSKLSTCRVCGKHHHHGTLRSNPPPSIAVLHEERFLAKPIVSVSAFYFYVQRRESILSATASSIHMCMPPCPHASIQCSIR